MIDADLGATGEDLLLACKDRSLWLVNLQTGEQMASVNYEARPDVILRGMPVRCALGLGVSLGRAFVVTRDNKIAAWNWQQDILERLDAENDVGICCFKVLPTSGQLFLSTASYGRILDKQGAREAVPWHTAPVTDCFITDSQKIVSVSQKDNTIRWFSGEGLKPLVQRHQKGVTATAKVADSDDVLVGDYRGWVWRQPPDREVEDEQIFCLFPGAVASLFTVDGETVVAADLTGRAFQVKLLQDESKLLRHSSGLEKQQAVFPAGENGLYWSLHQYAKPDEYSVLSLVCDVKGEKIVFRDRHKVVGAAVTQDGSSVCLASYVVRVFRRGQRGWHVVCTRETPAEHVAFLRKGDWLAVVLWDSLWLEIWQVTQNLPTVAAIELPGKVSCLSASGDRIAVGLASGNLMSLRFCS